MLPRDDFERSIATVRTYEKVKGFLCEPASTAGRKELAMSCRTWLCNRLARWMCVSGSREIWVCTLR